MAKLLFLSGSIRKGSVNTKLAKKAAQIAADIGQVDAQFVDLKDYDMPIYNGDLESESGVPENAKKLKQLFIDSDGFFIASPEYNSSFSALLKNSLDWISRSSGEGEAPMAAFNGKVAAIASASPGGLGGMRGLVPLRMLLSNISVTVIPQQLAISNAFKIFDDAGNITDSAQEDRLKSLVGEFINTTTLLSN